MAQRQTEQEAGSAGEAIIEADIDPTGMTFEEYLASQGTADDAPGDEGGDDADLDDVVVRGSGLGEIVLPDGDDDGPGGDGDDDDAPADPPAVDPRVAAARDRLAAKMVVRERELSEARARIRELERRPATDDLAAMYMSDPVAAIRALVVRAVGAKDASDPRVLEEMRERTQDLLVEGIDDAVLRDNPELAQVRDKRRGTRAERERHAELQRKIDRIEAERREERERLAAEADAARAAAAEQQALAHLGRTVQAAAETHPFLNSGAFGDAAQLVYGNFVDLIQEGLTVRNDAEAEAVVGKIMDHLEGQFRERARRLPGAAPADGALDSGGTGMSRKAKDPRGARGRGTTITSRTGSGGGGTGRRDSVDPNAPETFEQFQARMKKSR